MRYFVKEDLHDAPEPQGGPLDAVAPEEWQTRMSPQLMIAMVHHGRRASAGVPPGIRRMIEAESPSPRIAEAALLAVEKAHMRYPGMRITPDIVSPAIEAARSGGELVCEEHHRPHMDASEEGQRAPSQYQGLLPCVCEILLQAASSRSHGLREARTLMA